MQSLDKIPCVILSGGKSRRMGEDKSLLPFDSSSSLINYQYERLKPFFSEIYISSKIDKFDFLENKNNIILDTNEIYSPIIALESIFNYLKNDKIFIITVDTPLVTIESIKTLINESKNNDICVAQTQRTHNLCGVFSSTIIKELSNMIDLDIHKVGFLLKKMNSKYIEFLNDDEFINLNNKDEYKRALTIISKTNI